MHELAFPAACAHQRFLDLIKGHREDRLKQLVSNLANRFVDRPAIQLFGAAVPVLYRPFHIADKDGVVRQTEEFRLLPQGGLALAQRLLSLLALDSFSASRNARRTEGPILERRVLK